MGSIARKMAVFVATITFSPADLDLAKKISTKRKQGYFGSVGASFETRRQGPGVIACCRTEIDGKTPCLHKSTRRLAQSHGIAVGATGNIVAMIMVATGHCLLFMVDNLLSVLSGS